MNYDSLIHYLRYGWLIQNEIQSQIHLQWILNSVLVVIQSRYIRNTYRQNTYRNTTWIRMFERTYFNTCFNTYLNTPPDTLGHDVFQYMFQYTFKYTCGYTWPCINLVLACQCIEHRIRHLIQACIDIALCSPYYVSPPYYTDTPLYSQYLTDTTGMQF